MYRPRLFAMDNNTIFEADSKTPYEQKSATDDFGWVGHRQKPKSFGYRQCPNTLHQFVVQKISSQQT
jgi:hypothetical protein